MTDDAKSGHRRIDGSALLSAMMILALMTVLAVGSLRTVMRDRQVAGDHRTLVAAADQHADVTRRVSGCRREGDR